VRRLRERFLEGALEHPLGVEQRVVHRQAVTDVQPGRGLDVREGGARDIRGERAHHPAARGAQVGDRERHAAAPLAVEQEHQAQPARPVEAHHVALPVVLSARLVEDLEDALAHLLVGGRAVLVLDRRER
jgi:hypothetical protein